MLLLSCGYGSTFTFIHPDSLDIYAWQNVSIGHKGSVEIPVSWSHDAYVELDVVPRHRLEDRNRAHVLSRSDPKTVDFYLFPSDNMYEITFSKVTSVQTSKQSKNLTFVASQKGYAPYNRTYALAITPAGGGTFFSESDTFEILGASSTAVVVPSSISSGTKAAIGLGVILGLLALSIIFYLPLRWRRKRQRSLEAQLREKSAKESASTSEIQDLLELEGGDRSPPLRAELAPLSTQNTSHDHGNRSVTPPNNLPPLLPINHRHSHSPSLPSSISSTNVKRKLVPSAWIQPAAPAAAPTSTFASDNVPTALPELEELRARQKNLADAIEATESLERLRSEQENLAKEIKMAEERARRSVGVP